MTRSGYLPRVQDRSVHLITPGLDLFRSGQNFFFCDLPQTMRGVFKPHNSLRLFVFLGKMSVLLVLSAKPPCPSSKCRSMGIPPANGSDQNSGEGVDMALMGIPGEDFRLCLPAAPSLTPIRLRGLQIKPTTCRHFSPFTWSCAPHDHVKAMKRWQICSRLYASGQRVSMGLPPASITGVCGGGILPEHG